MGINCKKPDVDPDSGLLEIAMYKDSALVDPAPSQKALCALPSKASPDAQREMHTRRAMLLILGGALTLLLFAVPLLVVPTSVKSRKEAAVIRGDAPSPAEKGNVSPVVIALAPTAVPNAAAFVEISHYTALQLGDNYPAVQQLQTKLSALGYLDADEPGTVYNAALADAVSLFQRAHGMDVDGEADAELQDALFNSHALSYRIALGDEGDDVRDMQTMLKSLGYFDSKATGYFGAVTEAALRAFESLNGVTVDGIFDADDRERMYSPEAVAAKRTPAPTTAPTKRPATAKPDATPAQNENDAADAASLNAIAPLETLASSETPAPLADMPPEDLASLAPIVELPAESPAQTPEPLSPNEPDAAEENEPLDAADAIEGVIQTALAQLGKPYKRGNEGPNSYDCSGLVYYCLTQNGVAIGRYSAASYAKISGWKKISRMDNLRRGDLIFYHDDDSSRVSHVGICLGDGTMVDASSNKSQIVHRSHTTAYWQRNFVCGRRVF